MTLCLSRRGSFVQIHHVVVINGTPDGTVIKHIRQVLVDRKQDIINLVFVEQLKWCVDFVDLQVVVEDAIVYENIGTAIGKGSYLGRIKLDIPPEIVIVRQSTSNVSLLHKLEGITGELAINVVLQRCGAGI